MMDWYWRDTKTFYKDDVCYSIPIERTNYFEGMEGNIRQFLRAQEGSVDNYWNNHYETLKEDFFYGQGPP